MDGAGIQHKTGKWRDLRRQEGGGAWGRDSVSAGGTLK